MLSTNDAAAVARQQAAAEGAEVAGRSAFKRVVARGGSGVKLREANEHLVHEQDAVVCICFVASGFFWRESCFADA